MRNFVDYKNEVEMFEKFIKRNQLDFIRRDPNEYEIQKAVSKASGKNYKGNPFEFGDLKGRFLQSITNLGIAANYFFGGRVPSLRIHRDGSIDNGELFLINGYNKNGSIMTQHVEMTAKPLRECDFVGFSHEMGHLKTGLYNLPHEYFEYIEAYSIFLEYLAFKEIHREDAFELFKQYRLAISKEMSSYYLKCQKDIKNNGSIRDRYFNKEQRDIVNYIISLDLALALIERYENDRKRTNGELDMYVTGKKSMREVSKSLDIDTTGCKRLMKLIEKK